MYSGPKFFSVAVLMMGINRTKVRFLLESKPFCQIILQEIEVAHAPAPPSSAFL